MAATGADLSWKQKYDKSEKSLSTLKHLAHKGVADYEDLLRKYDQNQKQYEELRQRLVETESQLSDLQKLMEPVVDEYSNLDHRYNLEKACRNQAEHYATKVVQENKKLKRQSQMLVQTLSTVDVDITKLPLQETMENQTNGAEDQTKHFNTMIEDLQEQLVKARYEIKKFQEERDEAVASKKLIEKKYQAEVQMSAMLRSSIDHHEGTLKQFKRVSVKAVNEYEEVVSKFLTERKLKEEAERYASKVLSERDAMARESSVLIGSAMSDERLRKALMEIEDLNKCLESERTDYKQKIRDLEEELKNTTDAKEMRDLENQLLEATELIEQLKRQIADVNKWNDTLNKRSEEDVYDDIDIYQPLEDNELENRLDVTSQKLDIAEQKLKPPPPPPPPPLPPGGLFSPLKKLIKQSKTETKAPAKAQAPKDRKYEDALKEMMDRIKTGNTLRPAAQRRPSLPDLDPKSSKSTSAMGELNSILSHIKATRSMSEGHIFEENATGEMSELHATYLRIQGNKQNANREPQWHTGDPPNRNLSLIEEVEEKESLSSQSSRERIEGRRKISVDSLDYIQESPKIESSYL